jgi:hypothetical protein
MVAPDIVPLSKMLSGALAGTTFADSSAAAPKSAASTLCNPVDMSDRDAVPDCPSARHRLHAVFEKTCRAWLYVLQIITDTKLDTHMSTCY